MVEIGKAFDVSNWSGPFTITGDHIMRQHRPLSAARPLSTLRRTEDGAQLTDAGKAVCIREQGYDLGIIGTQNENITRAQMASCKGAGIERHAYGYLNFWGDPKAQVIEAIKRCDGFDVGLLWLDCEDQYAETMTEQQTEDWIGRAAQACEGRIRSGIYTARNWWMRQTGNSTAFAHFPLWNSTADGSGDLTVVSYGGWHGQPFMEQYMFDELVCGVNTDLNAYQKAPVVPPPPLPPGPPEQTAKERALAHIEAARIAVEGLPQ